MALQKNVQKTEKHRDKRGGSKTYHPTIREEQKMTQKADVVAEGQSTSTMPKERIESELEQLRNAEAEFQEAVVNGFDGFADKLDVITNKLDAVIKNNTTLTEGLRQHIEAMQASARALLETAKLTAAAVNELVEAQRAQKEQLEKVQAEEKAMADKKAKSFFRSKTFKYGAAATVATGVGVGSFILIKRLRGAPGVPPLPVPTP